MIAPARPTGHLLDSHGRPLNSAIAPRDPGWSRVPWEPDRHATMNSRGLLPDDRLLRPGDRNAIIRYLRWAFRTDPVLAALLYRYGTAIGSPQIRSITGDPAYDEERDSFLYRRMQDAGAAGQDMETLNQIISIEEALAGEVFAIFTREGRIQLIPSELCGSPVNAPANELHGIQRAASGRPTGYRFGVRLPDGRISFEASDGAQVYDAQYVHHLGQPSRVEEVRYAPRLAGVVRHIEQLRTIIESKVISIQNQSAFSLFITKNGDPALYAELLEAAASDEERSLISQELRARSTGYVNIQSGSIYFGETGEDVKPIAPQIDASDFGDFAFFLVEIICGPLGIRPEEVLFGFRRSNYSSARADKLGWRQTLDSIRRRRERYLDRWQRWQTRRAELFAELPPVPEGGLDEVAYSWPTIPAVDEAKAAAAAVAEHAAGLRSRSRIVAEGGGWGEQTDREIVAEAARMARLIKVESDPTLRGTPLADIPVTIEEIRVYMPNAAQAAHASAALALINSRQPDEAKS